MNLKENHLKYIFGLFAFILSFGVYIITLIPGVGFIDTGELATVCIKLGIAHPTGYPLFTLIGSLFAKLPFGEEIYRLNLMSAFICAAAVSVFYFFMIFLFNDYVKVKIISEQKSKKQNLSAFRTDNISVYFIALSSALILAFSLTFWNTANGIEVYSLHILFLIIVIWSFLKACLMSLKSDYILTGETYWIFFAFVLGLSFTNHLSTIFLAPGVIFMYFAINGFNSLSFKRILFLVIPFLIGLSVYIYFPLRADNSVISWGYPVDLTNIYRHISAKQFSVWMFTSTETAGKQFNRFLSFYPKEFVYLPLLISIPGLISIFTKNRKLFYFTVILFVFNILYAINYDIYDIESYFLLAFFTTAIWSGFGLFFIINLIKSNKILISAFTLLIPLLMLFSNYKEADESENYQVRDYTMNVLASAKQNSIIISSQWDFWLSSAWYFQFIKGMRPDVSIIDKELLRRSWYLRHIKIHYPELYERSQTEFETYNTELLKFENETPRYIKPQNELDKQDLVKINSAFINLLNSIVDKNYNDKSIYTTNEIEQSKQEIFSKEYLRIPEGVLLHYTKNKNFDESYIEPEFKYKITKIDSYYFEFLMKSYYDAYIFRANYLMNFSKFEKAEELLKKAIDINSQKQEAKNLLKKISELKAVQK